MKQSIQEKEIFEMQEREANYFALCLLMPEQFVREYVDRAKFKNYGVDLASDKFITEMGKHFQVPLTAAAIRLCQLYPEIV